MKAKNVEEDTEEDVIRKIGVIVYINLCTLDDSAHDLTDTSCSEDGHVKKVLFKGKEGSACDSDLNTDSKGIDCSTGTVELGTLTAKNVEQDTTNEEELNDTLSAQDDDDLEIPLTQNVQSQKYLKYKPAEIRMTMSMRNQEMRRLTKLTKLLKTWKLLKEWNMRKPRQVRKVGKLVKVRKVRKLGKVMKVKKKMKMNVKQGNFMYFTYILKQLFCRSS